MLGVGSIYFQVDTYFEERTSYLKFNGRRGMYRGGYAERNWSLQSTDFSWSNQ